VEGLSLVLLAHRAGAHKVPHHAAIVIHHKVAARRCIVFCTLSWPLVWASYNTAWRARDVVGM
jgi:hypothetical protein